jgi:hypothetical protein
VLGVDPARNITAFANASGVPTRCEYFNAESARRIAGEVGSADVIFANNVLAHVPDPNEIAAGIKILLGSKGTAHVEVPSLMRMIEAGAFDTIYHEHHSYFSLTALQALFNRHGLKVVDAQLVEIHGGSWHIQITHEGNESQPTSLVERERQDGVFEDRHYANFAGRVENLRHALNEAFDRFATVGAFGAAAKGVVLLNHFRLDRQRIPWVADVSPHKQGKFIPGTKQRIVPPSVLLQSNPQAALILPWNIRDEIVGRNHEYVNQGGRFIVPIPEVVIV